MIGSLFSQKLNDNAVRNRIQEQEGKEALRIADNIQSFTSQYSKIFSGKTKPSKKDYWDLAEAWKNILDQGSRYFFQAPVKRKTLTTQLMKALSEDKGRVAVDGDIVLVVGYGMYALPVLGGVAFCVTQIIKSLKAKKKRM